MALRTTDQRHDVRHRRVLRLRFQLLCKIVVTACLFWHIYAVALWNLPNVSPLVSPRMDTDTPVRNYLVSTGFMQGWGMFAPDPYSLDMYIEAQIHYADGTVRTWDFPRIAKMGYLEKYGKERWRKYSEVAQGDSYNYLWPPMARYAANVNNTDPHNPPVKVDLERHFRYVRASDLPEGTFSRYQFTSIDIKPEDLK